MPVRRTSCDPRVKENVGTTAVTRGPLVYCAEGTDNGVVQQLNLISDETRTHKIFNALEEICYEFDLSKPIWLDVTIAEFKKHAKARFYQDNFIEQIDFDYLEIQVIEED